PHGPGRALRSRQAVALAFAFADRRLDRGAHGLEPRAQRVMALIEEHAQIARGQPHTGSVSASQMSAPANLGSRLSLNASCAARKSGCCMHSAWACASASMAAPRLICASLSSI